MAFTIRMSVGGILYCNNDKDPSAPPPPPKKKKKKDKQVLEVIIAPYVSFVDHVVKLKQLARMC